MAPHTGIRITKRMLEQARAKNANVVSEKWLKEKYDREKEIKKYPPIFTVRHLAGTYQHFPEEKLEIGMMFKVAPFSSNVDFKEQKRSFYLVEDKDYYYQHKYNYVYTYNEAIMSGKPLYKSNAIIFFIGYHTVTERYTNAGGKQALTNIKRPVFLFPDGKMMMMEAITNDKIVPVVI